MIVKLLSFVRVIRNNAKINDIKIDSGGGANITAEGFGPAGDDSHPLKTDYVFAASTRRSGGAAVVGYVDPINDPLAAEGDKRIYARNPVNGEVVTEVWLKNDGTATVSNANGEFTLKPDGSIKGSNTNGFFELQNGGDFAVNGVIIAANGNVTIPSSLSLNGKEIDGHTHPITWTDPAGSGTSGSNN